MHIHPGIVQDKNNAAYHTKTRRKRQDCWGHNIKRNVRNTFHHVLLTAGDIINSPHKILGYSIPQPWRNTIPNTQLQ